MSEEEESDLVWNTLIEPATTAFIERMGELNGLVHYTTFAALEGIIRNEEVWFSSVAAMNDFDEVAKGKRLLETLASDGSSLNQVVSEIFGIDEIVGPQFNESYKANWGGDLFDTFVTCWSTCELDGNIHDNLSMWRGYAADGNGAAIVIDPVQLGLAELFSSRIVACPVFYESEAEFEARAKRAFEHFLANLRCLDSELLRKHSEYVTNAFAEICFHLSITHKHPGFRAEKEWRFVWRRHQDGDGRLAKYVHARNGARGMYEYFCFPLKPDPEVSTAEMDIRKIIREIMIGPTDDAYLKSRATRSLLERASFDLDKTKVTISEIPFRSTKQA